MSLGIKFYRNSSIALLCINLVFLVFFFSRPRPHHHGPPDGKKAKRHLNLTDQQQADFVVLATQHQAQMINYNQQQRLLVEQYFAPLTSNKLKINTDSLLNIITTIEQQKIEVTYRHFEEVKAILREEQYARFEDFVDHAIGMILKKKKKK